MLERRAGNDIEFDTADGPMSAYRSIPAAGRGPGVVVLDDSGANGGFARETCERLSRAGFVALAPALPPDASAGADRGREPEAADADAAVRELQSCQATERSRVGVVGFGRATDPALRAAAGNRRIGALALCYGVDRGAAIDLERIACRVFGVFGGRDPAVGPEALRAFEEKLRAAGVFVKTVTYEEARDGFLDETRPDVHDAVAAAAAWDALLAFLRAEL